ncbi:2-dehydropantoate 2-reductase [Pseudalkalibacillus caeni]|nr:2-dehydropantoate 2-reductase [Pseudalkalibacillus caeni]
MDVGIVGGGAIGLLFASYLKRAGHMVTIYTKRAEQAMKLTGEGLVFHRGGSVEKYHVEAFPIEQIREHELLIIAVKQYQLEDLSPYLKSVKKPESTLLYLQNGMGHVKGFKENGWHAIVAGVVEHGAKRMSDHEIVQTGFGKTKISLVTGQSDLHRWTATLHNKGFPIEIKDNWHEMLSRKLVVNCAINPLTAIFKVPNGELLYNDHFQNLMKKIVKEATFLLHLDEREMWDEVVAVCKYTEQNRSSMLTDIENNRKTEIEAINGFLVEKGNENNIPVPYNDFVYKSVSGMEQVGKA